jgi:hypothetical protein
MNEEVVGGNVIYYSGIHLNELEKTFLTLRQDS